MPVAVVIVMLVVIMRVIVAMMLMMTIRMLVMAVVRGFNVNMRYVITRMSMPYRRAESRRRSGIE
ncbi:MAG TPA: hypothetical protein VMA09_07695 [Candidatus Binataceae bacterium]|nr:hypothetical protein [Candidatus Binataceae bacterium]